MWALNRKQTVKDTLTQTTVSLSLEASPEEKQTLLRTMETFNRACNLIATEKRMTRFRLHKRSYRNLRELGLSSQMTVRVIGKVADALKREAKPRFYFHGAVPYDQRNIRLRGDGVSISTIEGRKRLRVRTGEYQRTRLLSGTVKSGMLLCYMREIKKFHLAVVADSKDPPSRSSGILGIDLGIKNIAVDSEGRVYTDERVERVRTRYNELRGRLQRVGTKSAKRHLKKMSGRERRFKRDLNHCISKQIVRIAKGTCSTIAMEDLTGIRGRTTVGRRQRDRHSKWAFLELRRFVEYKTKRAGVPTTLVDPKNTSRTCPKCLLTTKKNGRTRDLFRRTRCGWTAPADYVGALNIRGEAAFSLPIVALSPEGAYEAAAISLPLGGRS